MRRAFLFGERQQERRRWGALTLCLSQGARQVSLSLSRSLRKAPKTSRLGRKRAARTGLPGSRDGDASYERI